MPAKSSLPLLLCLFPLLIFVLHVGRGDAATAGQNNSVGAVPMSDSISALARPRDCLDLLLQGGTSGVYTVYPGTYQLPVRVYCDQETDRGGWTVIQRRQDGSVDFFRTWLDYAIGFGDTNGEFWLGNNAIHSLTVNNGRVYNLRVDLFDWAGNSTYEKYSNFKIDNEFQKYALTSIGSYVGTAGDSLTFHLGMLFSTPDQDNDRNNESCANLYHGAWWYASCHASNLNGQYFKTPDAPYAVGVVWYNWLGHYYSLKRAEMKIRPAEV